MSICKKKLSIPSNTSSLVKRGCKSRIFQTTYDSNEIVLELIRNIGVIYQPTLYTDLFFLLARLISPFVVPGQYSGIIFQNNKEKYSFLLPANIAGNKQYRPRDESEPIDCFLPLRAEPFVGRQSVFLNQPTATRSCLPREHSTMTKCVTLRGRHHLVPGHLASINHDYSNM
ncbi:hypothetical protein G5I_09061 [Acromyrmex echinatior]|uniref:Uncharacterized protein n=1 Tax=Acromyrmex echinatior TaxID=103372 RepID=F4WT79_ACREC|nr:hypothetical protein G5I_09061 [Acromyrmex echinatior]